VPYHHGSERKKFDACQHRLRQQYEQAGMSEAEIQVLHQLDLQEFLSERRYREHTQSFDENLLCDDSRAEDNADSELLKALSQKDLEMLTLYAIEGFNQAEIAQKQGITQQAISKRLAYLKNYFNYF